MATKTSSVTVADATAAQEAAYLASEERIIEARKLAQEWANRALGSEDRPRRELIAKLQRGDLSVTAADLAAADHEVARAKALATFYATERDRAERSGPFRPTTATVVAEVIRSAWGVSVEVVDEIPTEHPAEPTVYVRQGAPTVPDTLTGAVSCKSCEVVYRHSALHRAADWRGLENAFDRAIGYGNTQVANRGSSTVEDRAVVAVSQVWPPVMSLRDRPVHRDIVARFLWALGETVVSRLGEESILDRDGSPRKTRTVRVGRCSGEATRSLDGTDLRTEAVGTLRIVPAEGFPALHPKPVWESVQAVAANSIGEAAESLGRVSKLEVRHLQTNAEAVVVEVRATFSATVAGGLQ